MPDQYASFAALAAMEHANTDYEIEIAERDSQIAIIAPHGGHIEPMTTEIAREIAGADFNFYSFIGLKPNRPHEDLHITSHKFDEPHCIQLVASSDVVLAIHGRLDKADRSAVFVGGLDNDLKKMVACQLDGAGFSTLLDGHEYPAAQASNICNRGRSGRGVQLELPRCLRDRLAGEPQELARFAASVRAALGAG